MRCTRCDTDAGTAPICPACGGPTAPPAESAAANPQPSPAIDPVQARRRGWLTTLIAVGIAIVLGLGAGVLARKIVGPPPEPICESLCKFADVPAVVNNPNWQAQIAEAHCRCNALPKQVPPATPIDHPPGGH